MLKELLTSRRILSRTKAICDIPPPRLTEDTNNTCVAGQQFKGYRVC